MEQRGTFFGGWRKFQMYESLSCHESPDSTRAMSVRQTEQGREASSVSSNTSLFITGEGHDEKSCQGMMK